MQRYQIDPDIEDFIEKIVQTRSAYDIEGMEGLYAADQSILVLNADGTVTHISPRDDGRVPLQA